MDVRAREHIETFSYDYFLYVMLQYSAIESLDPNYSTES